MATTERARRARYDNIAVGAATGAERLISGDTVSKVEIYGGGFRTSTSNAEEWQSNVVVGTSVSNQAQSAVVGGELPEQHIAGVTNTEERTGSSNMPGFATNP